MKKDFVKNISQEKNVYWMCSTVVYYTTVVVLRSPKQWPDIEITRGERRIISQLHPTAVPSCEPLADRPSGELASVSTAAQRRAPAE